MSCACEVFGPAIQPVLHQFHERVARMAREQQERAARYIAAINDRRRARTGTSLHKAPPYPLLTQPDSELEIADFAAMHTARDPSQHEHHPEVRRG